MQASKKGQKYVSLLLQFFSIRRLSIFINVTLGIFKSKHSDIVKEKYALLDLETEGDKKYVYSHNHTRFETRLIVECKHASYLNSLRISVRMYGCKVEFDCNDNYLDLEVYVEPLRLAYI